MGPTNISLVNLYQADQALRQAQGRYEAAARNIRIQERRMRDLRSRLDETHQRHQEGQAKAGNLELDLQTRDAHIEKLREQQQNARNNREYQALLVEISTLKLDRNKVEESTMKALEEAERAGAESKELTTQLDGEAAKLEQLRAEIGDRLTELQAEIERLQPMRDEAAEAVPPTAIAAFERLAERYDGEALAALTRTSPKREEYACTACNMDVVTDLYNRLHSRDDLVFCPSCGRLLYIPEDLTLDQAVNKKKEAKPRRARKVPGAAVGRQSSAVDVLKSMQADEADDQPADSTAPESSADESKHSSASSQTQ